MSNNTNLEYNSVRPKLIIPEYGRHVQKLIMHACKIEDSKERQEAVAEIVKIMEKTNSEKTNTNDKDKLWKHAVRISAFALDVKLPDGEEISVESTELKPQKPSYPDLKSKFRHYGRYAQQLIDEAVKIEDEEKQKEFCRVIGSYMKLAYLNWNKRHFINDDNIKSDFKIMSGEKLEIPVEANLDYFNYKDNRQRKSKKYSNRRGKSKRRRRRN